MVGNNTNFQVLRNTLGRFGLLSGGDVQIGKLEEKEAAEVANLIRRNLQPFEEAGSVIAASFRRLEDLKKTYEAPGAKYFVARDTDKKGLAIGGAGIGTFHGLPQSEGVGEVRDLVVDEAYRGKGIGAKLLKRCIDFAKKQNYKRVYLETTPQMQPAQKLFIRFGFRPVKDAKSDGLDSLACYYLLEGL